LGFLLLGMKSEKNQEKRYPGLTSHQKTRAWSWPVRTLQLAQLNVGVGPKGKTIGDPSTFASMLAPSAEAGKVKFIA
jgi:hypothetical protein